MLAKSRNEKEQTNLKPEPFLADNLPTMSKQTYPRLKSRRAALLRELRKERETDRISGVQMLAPGMMSPEGFAAAMAAQRDEREARDLGIGRKHGFVRSNDPADEGWKPDPASPIWKR